VGAEKSESQFLCIYGTVTFMSPKGQECNKAWWVTGGMKCEDAQSKELIKYSTVVVTDGNFQFSAVTD
jgi:hypothetical protein